MATDRLTLQMSEDGGVKPLSDMPRVCATGTTPHRRTAAVKLAAKIFTALAIAFAISYVAARDYTPDASAAAGKIDVLNVGTCYATSSDVFGQDDCQDGTPADDTYELDPDGNAGIQGLETGSTVFATYAVDPKTSAEEPRAVLQDSDLIKISILDAGRDRRTPVLLRAGWGLNQHPDLSGVTNEIDCYTSTGAFDTTFSLDGTVDFVDQEICAVYKLINDRYFSADPLDGDALLNRSRDQLVVNRDDRTATTITYDESRGSNEVVEVRLPATNPSGDNYEDFLPLHRKFDGTKLTSDTVIRFYGYLENASGTGRAGCNNPVTAARMADLDHATTSPVVNYDATPPQTHPICDLTGLITFDEDVGSGSTSPDSGASPGVAPWITFGLAIGSGDKVHIRYVYYETSEREVLIGGAEQGRTAQNVDTDKYSSSSLTTVNAPAFTKDETGSTRDKLLVEAVGDGVTRTQHLRLEETGRFTGRYEGYLRLTDANGNVVGTGANAANWGRETGGATDSTVVGAAVLGVQGGPVNIRYRDFEGNIQTMAISVDTEPPELVIENPTYKENFPDERVRIVGTFSDGESKLREDSFRLFLDNKNDTNENGVDGTPVFNFTVSADGRGAAGGKYGCVGIYQAAGSTVAEADLVVQLTEDYLVGTATGCSRQFGVVAASDIFLSLEDAMDNPIRAKIDPDNFNDGAEEGVFDDIARLNIDLPNEGDELNNAVDFQAFVLDIAGNVGFSDSDLTGPTFINDYGTKDVGSDRKTKRYNVLGWYSRHIISIDQQDPRLKRSITGFYGENDDDEPEANVRGIMLLFDAAIDGGSVDRTTFRVQLDAVSGADPADAEVTDVSVVGDTIYLLLSADLAPDATPKLSVNSGRSVRDPAGNALTSNDDLDGEGDEARELESEDGIAPTFVVELSNGSGTGTGNEGPGSLTKDSIVVRVTSNEDIQGAPTVTFVCKGFTWTDDLGTSSTADDVTRDEAALLASLRGKLSGSRAEDVVPTTGACDGDLLTLENRPAYSRPGNAWEYQWRNAEGTSSRRLPDGDVTAIAFGRDTNGWRDVYAGTQDNSYNWGASSTKFEVDSVLNEPTRGDTPANIALYGSVQPSEDAEVFESRPFVLLTFVDASTVDIVSFEVDDTAQEINSLGNNRFLYWPEELSLGKHKVDVEAVDAADNTKTFSYEFTVKARTEFTIELLAGWNAVSVPAMPADPAIENVFTIGEVDQVVSWDSTTPGAPWRIATKVDGVWSTNAEFAPLDTIVSGNGYWVHANGFVDQPVMLAGIPDRESAANAPAGPVGISTVKGWNFVGVVDTDGDQTQDGDFGTELMNSKQELVTATSYLRTYKQAYTWDPIKSQFNVIEGGDNIEIGDGIWVYYADGFNLAP